MRNVTMQNMLDAMTQDLNRDIHDPATEHYSLSLLQKALIAAKEHISETFMTGVVEVPAPVQLQTGSLAAIVMASVAVEAVNFGYTPRECSAGCHSGWLHGKSPYGLISTAK